jgi:molybdopterin/thiamine biosynthesis adenylyltransferase
MKGPFELRLTGGQWNALRAHLFPGDDEEHGAVILAGVAATPVGTRLVAREIVLAQDGVDYVPGQRGYRMLTADFVARHSDRAAREGLAYIAVHCHGGTTTVDLSPNDRRSQERGYPALLDILDGPPVAGAVFATAAAAADVWLPDRTRHPLSRVVVSGSSRLVLAPAPGTGEVATEARYSRQALLFGAAGQSVLAALTVAVVGCGGVGSVLVELLARLGVGHLILIDDDIVEPSNLPRLVGATRRDAMEWLTRASRPRRMQALGRRLARKKVRVATRVAKTANVGCTVTLIDRDVTAPEAARALTSADFVFLAADSFRARLLVNAVCFQYGIPGVQLGAKVRTRADDGAVTEVYSVVRPFGPEAGCLWCNRLIPPGRLADEAVTADQRRAQRYVDDDEIVVPSVITLNALAASYAANEFLFHVTGLPRKHPPDRYVAFLPMTGEVERTVPRRDACCPECGTAPASRRGRADTRRLPTTAR